MIFKVQGRLVPRKRNTIVASRLRAENRRRDPFDA